MNKTVPLVLSALLIVASCAIQDPEIPYLGQSKSMLFTAYCAGPETKSSILADNSVMWSPNEQIMIFNSTSLPGAVFTSTNTQPAARAEFLGEMVTSAPGVMDCVYAFYPASAAISFDGSSITAELPHLQEAVGGSFADNTNLTLAKSTDTDLSFYNICSGFRFSVTHTGIKSVTFRGNNNEDIAGKFSVGMGEDGKPTQPVILEGQKVVTLSAPEGKTFEVGPLYYLEILPQTFSKGFTVTFETANESGSRSITSSASFARSSFNRGIDFDKSIDYSVKNMDAPIVFADQKVKEKLVAAFDTNNDGEISFIEAAEVTTVSDIFKNDNSIVSFDEFQYFSGITSINDAFMECENLISIKIPDGVKSIKNAFYGCSSLTSIIIPKGVKSIDGDSFIIDNSLYDGGAFMGCSSLTSVTMPSGLVRIGGRAFSGCGNLTSIVIPNGVTEIGYSAFEGCSSLTSIVIPDGVTKIGSSTFNGCSSLASIIIPAGVIEIGWQAFCDCSSLTSIIIPDGVTEIGFSTFSDCSSLTSITIPDGVTVIDQYAFKNCSSLTAIDLPDNLTSIGMLAFYECGSLTSIIIPNGVTSIGRAAFYGCNNLISAYIPNSITSLDQTFSHCSSLTSVTIPESVTSMNGAFSGCSSLTSVTIPESVTSMNGAFGNCSSLTSIAIPDGVISMDNAFRGCTGLTSIDIPESVLSIDGAFSGCSNLTSTNIPERVVSIGDETFYNCEQLQAIIIPDGVTFIGERAFSGCRRLITVNIPDGVTNIGDAAFEYCRNLATLIIPDGVTTIGAWAFSECRSLSEITIPKTVTSIGPGAFFVIGVSNLSSIYMLPSTPPTLGQGQDLFGSCETLIYVPVEYLDSYLATSGWSVYADRIQAIPE